MLPESQSVGSKNTSGNPHVEDPERSAHCLLHQNRICLNINVAINIFHQRASGISAPTTAGGSTPGGGGAAPLRGSITGHGLRRESCWLFLVSFLCGGEAETEVNPVSMLADREYGVCDKCKQKLLLNHDKLCIHCELDSLREHLNWKDMELSQRNRECKEFSEKLNGLYTQLHTILSNRKA